MIFELDLWARFLVDNNRKLEVAFNNLGGKHTYEDEAQPFFEFENCLFNFAFFLRRLIEEAEDAVALKKLGGQLSPSDTPVDEVLAFGKTSLSFPGSIGPKFRLNQSYSLTIRELCDQVIHNRLLNLSWPAPDEEAGFFVASDKNAATRIIFVGLEEITKCVNRLGEIAATRTGEL